VFYSSPVIKFGCPGMVVGCNESWSNTGLRPKTAAALWCPCSGSKDTLPSKDFAMPLIGLDPRG